MGKGRLLVLGVVLSLTSVWGQKVERGPYTLDVISEGIYQIQDYNSVRGRGNFVDEKGQSGYNNCSDIYLLVGSRKALMIDLSNEIRWAENPGEALRSLVNEYSAGRDLVVTVTHSHSDHLGMLYAFENDPKVHFWIPNDEFPNWVPFPGARTTMFNDRASIDLGGIVVKTLKVEGHTPGSTLFFVEGRDMVFTGDAIGSGSGVWIFTANGFAQYKQGINKLIEYINNPTNGINKDKLMLYGGHSLQAVEPLGIQYIYDMAELIKRIETGGYYETLPMLGNVRLDTHYKYGLATITWSRAAEKEYLETISQ